MKALCIKAFAASVGTTGNKPNLITKDLLVLSIDTLNYYEIRV